MTDNQTKISQSTNHILMVEPACFYANPQTMETNAYQVQDDTPKDVLYAKALQEFRDFRNALLAKGVVVTTMRGYADCPDMVFPNCMSTHEGGRMYLYPMYHENRRAEHSDDVVALLGKSYPDIRDWRHYIEQDLFLESTASICRDRVNKVAYSGLSPRTSRPLVEEWLDEMGYEAVIFDTESHAGIPVYHTDCVMWVGSGIAGICSDAIRSSDRKRVLDKIGQNHDIVEFSSDQLQKFCGNALEVRGEDAKRYLAISSGAVRSMSDQQLAKIEASFDGGVIHSDLSTLEKYGGGSARCCMMELF